MFLQILRPDATIRTEINRKGQVSRMRKWIGRHAKALLFGIGAAAAAGVGIGLFKDLPDAARHIQLSGRVEPDADAERLYQLTKKRYAMLYPALREAFRTRE